MVQINHCEYSIKSVVAYEQEMPPLLLHKLFQISAEVGHSTRLDHQKSEHDLPEG